MVKRRTVLDAQNRKALLTDMYQLTMSYAYWKSGRHEEEAVFELFFRKNPFKGEFTLFAGLEEVLRYATTFSFSPADLEYLRETFPPNTDPAFFDYLATVDCSKIKIYALKEGSVCFPRIPLIRVEGPLAVGQMMETALLNLTNFPSLITTNARRMRIVAGDDKRMMEFGLRRAQGPDGAVSASRYSYVGGFDGTSNCLAGKLFGMNVYGTHAHAFVSSFHGLEKLSDTTLDGKEFYSRILAKREELGFKESNISELMAFTSYAQSFPDTCLCLVDTYDTLASGVPNFVCVALVLREFGHNPLGIRLDSGDLAYLSKATRDILRAHGLGDCSIVASNDINENVLISLADQGHEIDSFGIGTNLVTCQAQPALGMVYKLVEIQGKPCMKLSNEFIKTTIPGKKSVYRLVGSDGSALCDFMSRPNEPAPQPGQKILCAAPFYERKRCYIIPSKVEPLCELVFDGKPVGEFPTADQARDYAAAQISLLRKDTLRKLNPTPYKVSVSQNLAKFVADMWTKEAPIQELS